ncbi:transient-receptor-potential-like protein [Amphiura filiformis]|uniref:transient-receptor-potential-like protein n=1 Tax=Amphiura filiformis TaxID=82378 RepID=UPI003B21E0C9
MDTTDIAEFLKAVEKNDVDKVASLLQLSLQHDISLDVNAVQGDHQTPLIAAIASKNIEMTSLLLEHGAKSDDILFYCIDAGCDTMVKLICEHLKAISQETLTTALNTISTDNNFKPVSSPLIYASRENSHEIVKALIEYGAEMPDLQTVLDHSKGDTYEQYLTCYSWHQAISSEAYLLYASKDPIQAAVDAGKAILEGKSVQQHHLRSDYEELITQLDLVVTKYFAMASSEHEIGALLWKNKDDFKDDNVAQVGILPQRIHDSLSLQYKQFISSTACTHFVLDQWYMSWKELSDLRFTLWTVMVIIFQPILCLAYMFLPFKCHRQIMKTPYVRFLVHLVSRIYFIGFIVYITIETSSDAEFTENKHQRVNKVLESFTNQHLTITIIAYAWVLGMTWREICELFRGGFWNYWKDVFNYADILQLGLYWLALICDIWSYVKKLPIQTKLCGMFLSSLDYKYSTWNSIEDVVAKYTICDQYLVESVHKRDSENVSFPVLPDPTQNPTEDDDGLETFLRHYITPEDPALLGDALFGVATVLSFLALLRDFVVVAFVGTLRVSFGKMISDVVRFLILFIFVWISFALGMTQLYTTYDIIESAICYDHEDKCIPSPFKTLSDSLGALFWSLFNAIDEESMRIEPDYKITFAVGEALYAIYLVVVVVVMFNALIAMMSNTYTRVEENSEVEWKVARTNLMAKYMTTGATLPPPYNLIPTLRTIRNWISASCKRICRSCRSDYQKPMEKTTEAVELQETNSYQTLMETLVDRYVRTYVDSNDDNKSEIGSGDKLTQELTAVKDSLNKMGDQMELILQFIQDNPSVQSSRSSISQAKKIFFK